MNPNASLDKVVMWFGWTCVVIFCAIMYLCSQGCTTTERKEAVSVSADALTCRAKISALIRLATSCEEARVQIAELVRTDPNCTQVFLGHDISLDCRKAELDGGSE